MTTHRLSLIALAALAGLTLPVIVAAQVPPATEAASPPAFRPGLGDVMTMLVQPRHLKLALAGREKNWVYAAYELHELEEAFERVERYSPVWRKFPIAEMPKTTKEPMDALEQTIKAGDSRRFDIAFGQLTTTCNTCHQGAERGMIVIRRPEMSPFPNQDFRPAKQ
jgi:hypothetical protein